jgi:hypothetical protein
MRIGSVRSAVRRGGVLPHVAGGEGGDSMSRQKFVEFHLPVRPYSPIDAHNRSAAAKGSPRYAALTSHSDYNGHHVTLSWNDYRRYYVAEYFWAGRIVIARGDFATCLRATLDEYARGALGASATILVPDSDTEALDAAGAEVSLIPGSLWREDGGFRRLKEGEWWTWRHAVGHESARDMANPGCPVLIFDWQICQEADNRAAYEAMVRAKYGRVYQ